MVLLSKSKYLKGLQCPLLLWYSVHERDKIPEISEQQEYIMQQGTKIGQLAKKLYPKGVDLEELGFKENLEQSKKIKSKTMFEPGFVSNNCYSRADILKPNGESWDIIEVKSGTRVKEENIQDVAFQKKVYENAGLNIKNCYLLTINNEYVKKGKIELEKLFKKNNVTKEISEITVETESMQKIINTKTKPKTSIGPHCNTPYKCRLCWNIPEHNVFELHRGGKTSFKLFEQGIKTLKNIPDSYKLTSKQRIQVNSLEKTHVNKKEIQKFLDSLEYPLYFLDFETYNTPIPITVEESADAIRVCLATIQSYRQNKPVKVERP